MTGKTFEITLPVFRCAALGAFLVAVAVSCAGTSRSVLDQEAFTSPEASTRAVIEAAGVHDLKRLRAIFGPESDDLLSSGDEVADRTARRWFVESYEEQNRLETVAADERVLHIGKEDWPFPIPIVKVEEGWIFDTEAGMDEVLNRRIGRNELNTIEVGRAIADAQKEYALKDWDNDGLREYAKVVISSPGKKDGLYWEVKKGEEPSPLGLLVARAVREEYRQSKPGEGPSPYHGYYYRLLTAQGENAPGAAFDYEVNGNLIGGFALIAYPAEYGSSGIMSFIVNHDGVVYQKDLSEKTEETARNIKVYDPDKTWKRVD